MMITESSHEGIRLGLLHRNYDTVGSSERGIFRAAKELCRFVMTTIVVANATKCTASAASIIKNYHKTTSRNSRKGAENNLLPTKNNGDNLNLWHFRTFSTCSVSLDSPFDSDLDNAVMTRGGRRSRAFLSRKDKTVVSSTKTNGRQEENNTKNNHQDNYLDNPFLDNSDDELSVLEMRAKLGPVGLLVANAVDVGVTTAGSYISGGLLGYVFAGALGVPILFKNSNIGHSLGRPLHGLPQYNGLKEVQKRIGNWNSNALQTGNSWGRCGASFSGFHALTRVMRGGVEDRWNEILGSAATGAYLSRQGGPQAMLQGASTYAGFAYALDTLFGHGKNKSKIGSEFDFTDLSMESRGY